MSQKRLDCAQVRTIGQMMCREGMAQRVRRDLVRGDVTKGRKRFDAGIEPVACQVACHTA